MDAKCPNKKKDTTPAAAANVAEGDGKGVALTAACSAAKLLANDKDLWFFDSGCSQHMTDRKEWFKVIRDPSATKSVKGFYGSMQEVAGVGMKANLVSPGKLLDKGAKLQTEEARNGATAAAACNGTAAAAACTDMAGGAASNDTGAATASNGTAKEIADVASSKPEAKDGAASLKTYAVGSKATPNLWHACLGHVHFDAVKQTATSSGVFGMDLEKRGEDMPCTSCHEAKLTRESFPLHDEREPNPVPPRTVIVVPVPSVQGGEKPLDRSVGPLGSKAPTAPPPLGPLSVADLAPVGPEDGPLEVDTSMEEHEDAEEEVVVDEHRPNKGVPPVRFQPSAMTALDADDEDNLYDVAYLAEDECDTDSDDEVEYPDEDEEEEGAWGGVILDLAAALTRPEGKEWGPHAAPSDCGQRGNSRAQGPDEPACEEDPEPEDAGEDADGADDGDGEPGIHVRTGFYRNRHGSSYRIEGIMLLHWARLFAVTLRFGIYTSNAIESINSAVHGIRMLPPTWLLASLRDCSRDK
ncbi:unnamed protein product, partial [Closterium sp. NIES-65]